MNDAPGPLFILADTYLQASDFAHERSLGREGRGWIFIRDAYQVRGRRDGCYVELTIPGHWRNARSITERMEVLEILRGAGFARLDPSAVNGPVGESTNGTGGRETGQGPAHRFDHNGRSDPAPGVPMLACACGTVLYADDMHVAWSGRPTPDVTTGEAVPLPRIVCVDCALPPTVEKDAS